MTPGDELKRAIGFFHLRIFERLSPRTTEEVLQRLEQRISPVGRKMFEDFVKKVEKVGRPNGKI